MASSGREILRSPESATAGAQPGAARRWLRVPAASTLVVALSIAAAAYFSAAGLLLHLSFHSYGWDLGIFDQVLWNTVHGRPFAYSFREIRYLGDHFQPVLVLLSPLALLGVGPAPLLVVQGVALGAACVPLFAAVRRLAGTASAWPVTGAYVLGLSQARAVTYDFHPECFVPVLAFTALWGLVAERRGTFVFGALALLLLKEDAALLVLALSWVAWLGFGVRREAMLTAGVAVAYAAVVTLVVMPIFLGDHSNPLRERYGYLGDNAAEIVLALVTRPDLFVDQLAHRSSLEAALLVLLGAGLLPLLVPKLWPPLAVLILVPLLAQHDAQRTLSLHYMVVPGTFALVLAVVALRSPLLPKVLPAQLPVQATAAAAILVCAAVIFAWKSPLPPSFAAETARFEVDSHSRKAESFVDMVPDHVPVSAQATYVPHLSQREDIYEFPRVADAEWVLLDSKRPVPGYDFPAFKDCLKELPTLGFEVVREEDGIALWQRTHETGRIGACG